MAFIKNSGVKIAAIGTCLPSLRFDNVAHTTEFTPTEIRKVVAFAGIQARKDPLGSGHTKVLIFKNKHCIFRRLLSLNDPFLGQNCPFKKKIESPPR